MIPRAAQSPDRSHLELGANALHRFAPDPHVKFKALRVRVRPRLRPFFSFGYGLDAGTRFSRTWGGLHEGTSGGPDRPDPRRSLYEARAWIGFWGELEPAPDQADFLIGFGVGLVGDGVLDSSERAVLDAAVPADRDRLLEGIGAGLLVALEAGEQVGGLAETLAGGPESDWEAIGRGMARASPSTGLPARVDLGLGERTPQRSRLEIGLEARRDIGLGRMVRLPVVPTPEPPGG